MRRKDFTAEELLTRVLNNKSQKTYWDNVRELYRRGGEETFKRCYQLVKTGTDREKEVAVDILAQLGSTGRPYLKESLQLYFELLERALLDSAFTTDLLITVLHAIRFNNDTLSAAQAKAVSAFKSHSDKYVRLGVVYALLGVEHQVAVDAMVELTTDKFSAIRNWATFGIGSRIDKHPKQIITALWNRVNDKEEETRFEAIVGLAIRKEAGIKEVIIQELLTGEFGTLLFDAIEALDDADFLPALKRLHKESQKDKTIDPGWLGKLDETISSLSAQ
ncbi:hypothetical protein [Chitinophaga sp. LS1]|uniref:hypothetical protein n=1 Tax=Chitinophaga sp. LS1 TaxID=3051176 RepID=UPI002AAB003C|nr:hypothetical protein [Chitinophaga sp. LS1]WPV64047.1 hypothetical protein QQL36_19795 [Chitinophaga sp. LS1]